MADWWHKSLHKRGVSKFDNFLLFFTFINGSNVLNGMSHSFVLFYNKVYTKEGRYSSVIKVDAFNFSKFLSIDVFQSHFLMLVDTPSRDVNKLS